jgi:hypothetical protein
MLLMLFYKCLHYTATINIKVAAFFVKIEDSIVEESLAETGCCQSRFDIQIPIFDKADKNTLIQLI